MHMHTLAPATPWPPRISRKTPGATLGDEHDEQPSPLDRKVPSTLKLGNKLEPGLPSSAPTSATLTSSACDKEVGEVHDACRRETDQPMAPKLEQREDWNASDRWGMLRSDLATRAAMGSQQELPPMYPLRPAGLGRKSIYALPSYATAGSSEAAYRPSKQGAEACLATDQTVETNIYVNGLPKEMNDDMLYLLGSACGVVISHKAMMDRETGLCKGFGFLMYASSDMARTAIGWLNSHGFTSSFAKESFSARLRRMADAGSTNVYLSNLPTKMSVSQLEQLFNPHPIASLKILYDIHGESRGVAFVRLYDRTTAQRCIERLHGRVLPGTTLPLQVRFADSEAQKQLKHSLQQKHTLESLGLVDVETWGSLGSARMQAQPGFDGSDRMHSGYGVGGRARIGSPYEGAASSFTQPLVPNMRAQMIPEPGRGLGIEIPSHALWPHAQPGQRMSPAMLATAPAARAMYAGMEGGCILDEGIPRAPIASEGWDIHTGDMAAYLPTSEAAPPARWQPSRSRNDSAHIEDHAPCRLTRKPKLKAAVRVRVPGTRIADAGTRAVSDPMTMVAAQARIREALGNAERVRAAVSADNSLDLDDDPSSLDDDDDSASIDIQVHTDRPTA